MQDPRHGLRKTTELAAADRPVRKREVHKGLGTFTTQQQSNTLLTMLRPNNAPPPPRQPLRPQVLPVPAMPPPPARAPREPITRYVGSYVGPYGPGSLYFTTETQPKKVDDIAKELKRGTSRPAVMVVPIDPTGKTLDEIWEVAKYHHRDMGGSRSEYQLGPPELIE